MRDLHTVILWEDAVRMFERDILPNIRQTERRNGSKGIDSCMRSEAWNNWTDGLCKAGEISDWQYENWSQPDCCEKEPRW